MARNRKNVNSHSELSSNKNNGNSSSSTGSDKVEIRKNGLLSYWKSILGFTCFIIAAYIGYLGYLETRVNTPFDDNKVVQLSGLDIPEKFWGSYRPGHYFGMKTRDPDSLVMGLMWYSPLRLQPGGEGIRHWCLQSDNLRKYGWTRHDGTDFGDQEILDGPFKITTSFVKRLGGRHGGDWTARISIDIDKTSPEYDPDIAHNETLSVIWYTSIEGAKKSSNAEIHPSGAASRKTTGVRGYTSSLGDFKLNLVPYTGKLLHESYLSTTSLGLHLLRETIISSLRLARDSRTGRQWIALAGQLLGQGLADKSKPEPNLVATQLTFQIPFSLDVVYESGSFIDRENELSGDEYSSQLSKHIEDFDKRFEKIFELEKQGYNASSIAFAKAAFSNLIGGIGYFYGSSRVLSARTQEPVPYWKSALYTAVPSRSHFPRGFLWDEGFHGLVLAQWDKTIALDIIAHWFDLMNAEGWIPREQILGVEAVARVPEEFVTQRNTNANPPTFFLTLLQIIGDNPVELDPSSIEFQTLNRMFPRLQAWYNWFNTTQTGEVPTSYRWRGRDPDAVSELNPKTLTSGLDDYPRASHPTTIERHVDLRCWMQLGARALAAVSQALGRSIYVERYSVAADILSNPTTLADLHWSSYTDTFSDYGFHTDSVTLKRPQPGARGASGTGNPVRVTLRAPEPRFVDSAMGYVSLFPLLLQVLPPDCPRLGRLLQQLTKPELLWTPYGLRSLSKSSPLYMKRNTEHDPPYWRGQIWINMNYLAVRALHHYGNVEGPHAELALSIYKKLRNNVINNILKEYHRTGYLWEQYSDKTGQGSGCKPFTGWTSLVVLMMAEKY